MKDFILFWMQWSWKWTQWKILAQKYWMKIFETGQELRNIVASWSNLWNKIKAIMDSWNLVTTKIVMEVVDNFLNDIDSNDSVIFDWIPRNKEQYDQFEEVMKKFNRKPEVIYIKLEKEEAMNRLIKRFTCVWVDMTNNPLMSEEECISLWWTIKKRSDDTPEAISRRLDVFFTETNPIIENYAKEWRVFEVDWVQSVDEVKNEISSLI